MRKSKIYSYNKEELQQLANTSDSYADMLRKMEMCPHGGNPRTLKRILSEYEIDISKLNENRSDLQRRWAAATRKKITTRTEDILSGKAKCQTSKLLKRLVRESYKEMRCETCGISEWQGKPIVMQLHHIDGNRNNNSLNNLQVLCPNCHSQTDTFCGRQRKKNRPTSDTVIDVAQSNYCADCGRKISNRATRCVACDKLRKRKVPRPSKSELEEFLTECNGNFKEASRHYKVTDTCVHKWCKQIGLPSHSADYKNNRAG